MGCDIKQNGDGSTGLQGSASGAGGINSDGEFTFTDMRWAPTSLSAPSFVASRDYVLKSILAAVEVAGTDAGAVTATVYMAPSGTALSAGTALHSGTINLKGTAATNQALTLTAPSVRIPAGYRVGIVFTGTLTAATGCATAAFCPA